MTTLTAIDIESALIQKGNLAPPIVCLSWAEGGASGLLTDMDAIKKFVTSVLTGSSVVVGANIAYDFGCLAAEWPDILPLIWQKYSKCQVRDVQIRSTLVAIAEGRLRDGELFAKDGQKMRNSKGRITDRYSLDVCVREWLGREDAKGNDRFRLSYWLLKYVPVGEWPADARQYPVDDAVNTLKVAEAQGDLQAQNESAQCISAFCCHLGAMWGLRADPERVEALEKDLSARRSVLEAWAKEVGIIREDGTKNMAFIKGLVEKAYGGTPPQTAGGKTSTSREALEESGDAVLERYSEIGKVDKLVTYLDTLREAARVPLNVKPNILLATGRVSYEGMLQLLPRKGGVRECFKFRGIGSSVDYSAIEMATLAQVCLDLDLDSELAKALNADLDPHSFMGARILNMKYEDFLAKLKAGDKEIKDVRQAAKACLGADTEVLTDTGWKRIVDVCSCDKVWDGYSWVEHEGCIFQGEQETWTFNGVVATADHGVLTEHGFEEFSKVRTKSSLFQSALSSANLPYSNGEGSSTRTGCQQDSSAGAAANAGEKLTTSAANCFEGMQGDASGATSSRSSQTRISSMTSTLLPAKHAHDSSSDSRHACPGARTLRTRITTTTAGEESGCGLVGSKTGQPSSPTVCHSLVGTTNQESLTESTTAEGTSQETFASQQSSKTCATVVPSKVSSSELTSLSRKLPVFDLVNAGPNHRFTIMSSEGPIIVSNCNFGYPGMMGAAKFVVAKRKEKSSVCEWFHHDGRCGENKVSHWRKRDLQGSYCVRCIEEAQKLRDFYTQTWTEIPAYWRIVSDGLMTTDTVNQHRSNRVRGGLEGPSAANTLFQGLAADGAKRALELMTEEMYLVPSSPLYGSRLSVFAHDETIIDIPDNGPDFVDAAARRQAELMIRGMREFVPDVLVKAEPALMRHWSKSAEAVLDSNGRFIPYEDGNVPK